MAKKAFVYDGTQWVDIAQSTADLSNYANLTTTPISGFRNAIINGDFRINQRGFSSTTSDGTYGFDRWRIQALGGGTTTYSAVAFTPGNVISGYEPTNYARIVTSGQSATNVVSILRQPIEDVRTFAGQTVTLSFWARSNSGTPSVALELGQNFGTGGSAIVNNNVGKVALSTTWNRYSLTVTLPSISGKTIASNDHHLLLSMWVSAGTDFSARTNSLGIQTNTFDFWGVQIEKGTVATPFEQRPIGTELALCQRYYEKSYDLNTTPGTDTLAGTTYAIYNANTQSTSIHFKVSKRAQPGITFYTRSGVINQWTIANVGNASASGVSVGENSFLASVTGASSGQTVGGHWVASAEL